MKDNLNIEELFKEKFNSFEGEVSPDAWTNIQQGMNMTGAAAKTGMSLFVKTVIVSGGIIAATVAGVYFFSDSNPIENVEGESLTMDNNTIAPELEEDNKTLDVDVIIPTEETSSNPEEIIESDNITSNQNNAVVLDEFIENSNEVQNLGNTGSQQSNQFDEGSQQIGDVSADIVNDDNNEEQNDVVNNLVDPSSTQNVEPLVEKEDFPTGKMDIEAGDKYAPSTYSFKSNAKNHSAVKWEFGDGSVGNGETVDHTFEKPGKYTVRMAVVGEGEIYEESQTIVIQTKSSIDNVPNIITPNGDRINDFFAINTTEIETFFITILDAKGNTVFESKDVNFRWY